MYRYWHYITLLTLLISASSHAALPKSIDPLGEKQIIVDPQVHKWGAYDEDGKLVRSGLATCGSSYCRDLHRSCRTKTGTFRIESLGDASCKSHRFPLPRGGAPMPYCMFFNNGQALHASNQVVAANASHGCVRLQMKDAKWIRFNFAEEPTSSNEGLGTLVTIKSY
jgi:lipoprotein-anchoring transpeptidase ErfK/SrfK